VVTPVIAQDQEIPKCTICQESDDDTVGL